MGAPYSRLQQKTEDAMELLVVKLKALELGGLTYYKGLSLKEITTPRIDIVAISAEAQRFGSTMTGNWIVEGYLSIVGNKADITRGDHGRRVAALEDILSRDDIEDVVNNLQDLQDYTMFPRTFFPTRAERFVRDDELHTRFFFECKCAPSAITLK